MGKFENDIEHKLGNFSIKPSAQVWEGVENALHEKKKKRATIWWWIPVTGLLLLGFSWWMFGNGNHENKKILAEDLPTELNKKIVPSNKKETEKKIEQQQNVLNKTGKKITVLAESKQEKQTTATTKNFNDKENTSRGKKVSKAAKKNMETATGEIKIVEHGSEVSRESINVQNNPLVETNITTSYTSNKKDSTIKKDSLITALKQQNIPKKDSATALIDSVRKKVKEHKNNPHQWYATVGSGLSLVKGNNLFIQQNADSYTNASTASSPSSVTSSAPSIQLPNTGFFALIGIGYKRKLSKYWDGNIGLQYRYIQNKQAYVDSFAFLNNLSSPTVTNTAHWLDLPVNAHYTFNPNSNTKFGLLIGGSIAWAFYEKWAIVPYPTYYYYNKALNNQIILGLSAGAFLKTNSYTISLMGEQSLTPIHKLNDQKYYWRQWSMQLSMPINSFSKPKK